MKKYELTDETRVWEGRTLHRIRALIELETSNGDIVNPGDLGGWVESERNLAHESNAWVSDEAIVCDAARCCGSAWVGDHAIVSEFASVFGDAWVNENAKCFGHASISDNVWLHGNAKAYENAVIAGDVWCRGDSEVLGHARIIGDLKIRSAVVCGMTEIRDTEDIGG